MSKGGFLRFGTLRYSVLEKLEKGAMLVEAISEAISYMSRPASYERMKRAVYGTMELPSRYKQNVYSGQKLYTLLNHLKRQGLIERKIHKGRNTWFITKKGKKTFQQARERKMYVIPPYEKEKSATAVIVAFDISEHERWKRVWIRSALLSLDFSLLQKSVWIGKNKIPEKLIKELNKMGLLHCVHIFEVAKKGTLATEI